MVAKQAAMQTAVVVQLAAVAKQVDMQAILKSKSKYQSVNPMYIYIYMYVCIYIYRIIRRLTTSS